MVFAARGGNKWITGTGCESWWVLSVDQRKRIFGDKRKNHKFARKPILAICGFLQFPPKQFGCCDPKDIWQLCYKTAPFSTRKRPLWFGYFCSFSMSISDCLLQEFVHRWSDLLRCLYVEEQINYLNLLCEATDGSDWISCQKAYLKKLSPIWIEGTVR